MSTDHQRYSIDNQRAALQAYAKANGLTLIADYADAGRSGLTFAGRPSLGRLIEDVQASPPPFEVVLVYDVSRWGRFQDADESAYYEYICRRSGVAIIYCAEHFGEGASPTHAILKSIKRVMAAEYSRELSTKVFVGQCRLVELGYWQGAPAGFGLRRLLVSHAGVPKGVLSRGHRKGLPTDRVILVPGPADEVAVVRNIYTLFLSGMGPTQIATDLNRRASLSPGGTPWTENRVDEILRNEKYAGHNVFNRRSARLSAKAVLNDRTLWIRADHAFEAIIDQAVFDQVQAAYAARRARYGDAAMLDQLRALLKTVGKLSDDIVAASPDTPCPAAYRAHFGSLRRAYLMIGYRGQRQEQHYALNRQIADLAKVMIGELIAGLAAVGAAVAYAPKSGLITVNDQMTVRLTVVRCSQLESGARLWRVWLNHKFPADLALIVRMDASNTAALDVFILPRNPVFAAGVRLTDDGPLSVRPYRFDNFEPFYRLFANAAPGDAS
jgi:DNA invertase Pin-like site-specific DNA recombinase